MDMNKEQLVSLSDRIKTNADKLIELGYKDWKRGNKPNGKRFKVNSVVTKVEQIEAIRKIEDIRLKEGL